MRVEAFVSVSRTPESGTAGHLRRARDKQWDSSVTLTEKALAPQWSWLGWKGTPGGTETGQTCPASQAPLVACWDKVRFLIGWSG
jgi:hypothetical protein